MFFFSSRRRHTRSLCDWSSDVCSSDLGTEAIAWGLIAGMRAAGLQKMIFAGYPITPASLLLHTLANLKAHGVITFQAEDEIAAIGAVIGAAYAGALGVTSSSGPGMALKTEMLG